VTQQILAKIQVDAGPEQVVSARLLPTALDVPTSDEKPADEDTPEAMPDAESNGAPARAAGARAR